MQLASVLVGAQFIAVECLFAVESRSADAPFLITSWQAQDGLPQNSVQALAQTPDGYLWVGTKGGLARFDGVRFSTYGLADGLKGLTIIALLEDGHGGLWIGTLGGGLSHWSNGAISTLTMADGLAHNDVMALALADDGGMWVGTKAGLQHLGPKGFARVEKAEGLKREIVALANQPGKGLWITVEEKGLFYLHDGQSEPVAGPPGLELFHGYCLVLDQAGALWVSIGNGKVLRRDAEKWTVFDETHGLPFSFIYCLAEGDAEEMWAGSHDAGLYVFREGRFHAVPTSEAAIRAVWKSREGIIWAGFQSEGLCRITPRPLTTVPVGDERRRGQVNGLIEDSDGQFWITSYGGGLHHGPWDHLETVSGIRELGERPFLLAGLRMSNGDLYFAGVSLLLCRERLSGELRPVTLSGNFTALCEAADGSLLLGTREGEFKRLVNDVPEPITNWTSLATITSLVRGPKASVWVATSGAGLFQWEPENLRRWTIANGLPTDILRVLYQDPTGTLWIGTDGGGLAWLEGGKLHHVTSRQGLGDDVISQILEDGDGNLWLGGHRGIFRVLKSELKAVAAGHARAVHPLALDEADGMLAAECTGGYSPSGLRSSTGILYFSTVRGVVPIDPQKFTTAGTPPNVFIEEVKLDGKPIRASGQPLSLPPGARELEIYYTAFNYFKPGQIRFRHRLNGLEQEWMEVNAQRSARYSRLPPGRYNLQVSAANQDGQWQETAANLAFTVLPFFWQTFWFRILVGIGLVGAGAGAVWSIVRRKLQRQQAELEHRRALTQAELRMDMAASAAELGFWERDLVRHEIVASDQWRALLGFGKSERLHVNDFLERLHPDDRESVRRLMSNISRDNTTYGIEYRIVLPDGQIRWLASRGRPEYNREGEPILVRGVTLDITKRKLAEAAARDLSGQLINAQEDERRRIARELHDDFSQRLALMAVELDMLGQKPPPPGESIADRMEAFSTEVRNLSSEVHQLAYELHPAKLDQLGLVAAGRAFCKELSAAHQMAIEFEATEIPVKLPPDVALGLYRIMQEALHNSVKYSAATTAKVRLLTEAGELRLTVTDDGQGFDLEAARRNGSLGILSMHERARMLGGQILIQSSPGNGTKIEVRVRSNEAKVFPEST